MKKFTVVTMLLLALNAMANIQYVESTGAQYIQTGVAYTNTLRIVADFEFTQIPSGNAIANVVAWRSTGSKEAIACGSTYYSGAQYFCSQFSDSSAYKYAAIKTDTNRHVFDIQNGSQKLDGVEFGTNMLTIPSSSGSLYVFCSNIGWSNGGVNYADFSSIRLYSCKIYVGDELIRDYIPYAKDGVAGLYDKVGNSSKTAPPTPIRRAIKRSNGFMITSSTRWMPHSKEVLFRTAPHPAGTMPERSHTFRRLTAPAVIAVGMAKSFQMS